MFGSGSSKGGQSNPPQIPLAPAKRVQARFNPLADGLIYLVVFVGGFLGVGLRHVMNMLMPPSGSVFDMGTFVSNILACFLLAMLTEYMASASWIRKRVRQVASKGLGMGFAGGLSTMSGLMVSTIEGLRDQQPVDTFVYLACTFVCALIAAALGVALVRLFLPKLTGRHMTDVMAGATGNGSSGNVPAHGMMSVRVSRRRARAEVRQMKVADVAHSAAQAALEAAAVAQAAAAQAAQAAQSAQADSLGIQEPIEIQQSQALANLVDPNPVTTEIPLVADPATGEVR